MQILKKLSFSMLLARKVRHLISSVLTANTMICYTALLITALWKAKKIMKRTLRIEDREDKFLCLLIKNPVISNNKPQKE